MKRLLQLCILLSLTLAGCASEPANPWYETIKGYESLASSDFERNVLSDGVITQAEYEEAVARYISCAHDRGLEIVQTDAGYSFESTPGNQEELLAIDSECSIGNTSLIEGLWNAIQENPENTPMEELVVSCLKDAGAIPEVYDPADFRDDYRAGTVGDLATDDPVLEECMMNPQGR